MSCLIWLPLNGDLRNNGLSSVEITAIASPAPTYYTNGKIGKAYNANRRTMFNCPDLSGLETFTICFWAKTLPSDTLTIDWSDILGFQDVGTSGTVGNLRFETCYTTARPGIQWYDNSENNICNAWAEFFTKRDEWHHCVLSVEKDVAVKTYSDGELIQTNTSGLGGGHLNGTFWIGETNNIEGALNDVRVYDTALSDYEIKLLSQAAILKFPLDNNGLGAPNLFNTSGTISITSNGSVELINGGVKTTGLDKDTYFRIPLAETLTANTTYTVSCQATGMEGGKALRFGVVSQSSGFNMSIHNGLNVFSFTPTADVSTSLMFDDNLRTGLPIVTMTNWKLERGTKASPYVPSGLPVDTTIYDTSGFGNNATAANVTYSGDTARYTASSVFVSGSKITLPTITCSGFADSYTFAWWEKSTDANNKMAWGFSNGNRLNLYRTGGYYCWNTGDGGNNKFGTLSTSLTADGNWHHLAVTGDGTTTKLYIDGEFKANATAYKPLTGTQIYISGWDTGTGYFWDGSLSDFRIYGTALSAEDIYELYKVSAKIDRKGTMYSYGYVEE